MNPATNAQTTPARAHRVFVSDSNPTAWTAAREAWEFRELAFVLGWRDIQVRYKQAVLGLGWALAQPVAAMIIFSVFLGKFAKIPSDGVPYPLFAYVGMLPWTLFANSLTQGGVSLVGSSHLISKVYFQRILLPAAAVIPNLFDFGIALCFCLPLLLWFGVTPSFMGLLALPLLVVLTALIALGVSLWLSALTVKFRDIRHAIPFLVQAWMFSTPVTFPASVVPEHHRWLVLLNPVAGVVGGFRSALLGTPWAWESLASSFVLGMGLLWSGAWVFRRLERSFADIV